MFEVTHACNYYLDICRVIIIRTHIKLKNNCFTFIAKHTRCIFYAAVSSLFSAAIYAIPIKRRLSYLADVTCDVAGHVTGRHGGQTQTLFDDVAVHLACGVDVSADL